MLMSICRASGCCSKRTRGRRPPLPGDLPGGVPNLVHFYEAVQRLQLDVEQVVPMHGRLTTFEEIRQAVQTYGKTQQWTN